MREYGGWSRQVVVAANQLRAAPPLTMPRTVESIAVRIVVFFGELRENTTSCMARSPRHREGGGGSKMVRSHHNHPRPTPLLPDLNEARRTHVYLEKTGVQSLNST